METGSKGQGPGPTVEGFQAGGDGGIGRMYKSSEPDGSACLGHADP